MSPSHMSKGHSRSSTTPGACQGDGFLHAAARYMLYLGTWGGCDKLLYDMCPVALLVLSLALLVLSLALLVLSLALLVFSLAHLVFSLAHLVFSLAHLVMFLAHLVWQALSAAMLRSQHSLPQPCHSPAKALLCLLGCTYCACTGMHLVPLPLPLVPSLGYPWLCTQDSAESHRPLLGAASCVTSPTTCVISPTIYHPSDTIQHRSAPCIIICHPLQVGRVVP